MAQKIRIAMSLLSGVSYGGATYFKNLIPALAKIDKMNEYYIFIQKDHPLLQTVNQKNFIFHECLFNIHSPFCRFLWEQLVFPIELKKRRIDIVFTAKNMNIFFAPCKKIISIRNMEPLCYQNYKNHWILNVFSFLRGCSTKISIKRADRIVAVSKATKTYLEKAFPYSKNKIDIVYNGNPANGLCSKDHNQKRAFLLTASKFVTYANQLTLVKAYCLLRKVMVDVPPLWMAGGVHDKTYFKQIKKFITENDLTNHIKMLGLLPHEELLALYAKALIFIFPSTLEACPQTLIEAMACGVPIATSKIDPMPEICQNAALYFEPYDSNDLTDKIKILLTDDHLRYGLAQAGLERSKFFDWGKTAFDLIKVFQKV